MVKFSLGGGKLPKSAYGWIGAVMGILSVTLAATQFFYNWFGETNADKTLYSLFTLIFFSLAIGFMFAANFRLPGNQMITALKVSFLLFIIIMVYVMATNGLAMTLDTEYATYANNNEGIFTNLRMLTSITAEDVSSLEQWALGLKQIIRGLFMIIPVLCATWGGLSVLTANDISNAEGGILAIVAAFVVFFICWIFKGIDVNLMSFMTSLINSNYSFEIQNSKSFQHIIRQNPPRILVAA